MAADRRRIAARDGDRCIHCGTTEGLTIQHRANRGMGGRPSADVPSNLILMCGALNVALEQRADLAEWARRCGWKVSRHLDTREVAVWDAVAGLWLYLDDAWGRRPL